MAILISDEILKAQHLSEATLRLEVATILYDREVLSLGLAAQMAGLDRMQFQEALAEREIDLKYGPEDFRQDIATLRKLNLYGGNQ